MALRTLTDRGYAAFLEENGDRDDLWFFLHIPKTAGSSFRAELADLLTPSHNVHAYDGSDDDFVTRRRRAIGTFADLARTTPFRFASGHVPLAEMAPIGAIARTPKLFTMLREPVARVVSDYRYQRTRLHPDHAAFRLRYPTIERYLDAAGERDKMLRFLAPHGAATVAQTIDHVLDTFAFVGSIETYDTSFAVMMDLLDADRTPSRFLRKTEEADVVVLTPDVEARIRSLNANDVALYDALMEHVRAVGGLRAAAPTRVRVAPQKGFSAWRDV